MEIKKLEKRPSIGQDKKLNDKFVHFEKLINELKKKKIQAKIVSSINQHIAAVNSFAGTNKDFRTQIRKSKNGILKLINKELKLVPKKFYLFRWMSMGISIFGIPLGVVIATSTKIWGLFGVGFPIGVIIGMAIGAGMDKKAFKEGRQLDIIAVA